MFAHAKPIAIACQGVLVVLGCLLLWRHVLSPRARAQPRVAALAPWPIGAVDFLFFFLYVFGGAFIASVAVGFACKFMSLANDPLVIASTLGAHLGMLAGVGLFAI